MFTFRNLKFRTKILLLGIGSVLITILALVATVVWQSGQFNALAQDQFNQSAEADLSHIAEGVYNMVKAQDEAVQQQVNSSLHVAELLIHNGGQVRLADEKVNWVAVNEATQQSIKVQLPKMYVGDTWLGQFTGQYDTTPIVDHVQLIAGGTATIFQRMNEQGDMLRVATNILLPNKQRALGTYIPAVGPDGSPDPVISAILRGSVYRGSTFAVDAWYDSAYEPVRDESGQVIGMLYVGVKQESVESVRQAILRTQVGQTGYVYVLGGTGNDQGRYIISPKSQRDGESIWNARDASGNYIIQSLVKTALTLKFGETATERYQWQDPGDPAPRWKVARIIYYEPWHWVIVASINESEIQTGRLILESGQVRMMVVAGAAGLAIALVAGLLSVLLARSITRPIDHLAGVAAQVSAGNLEVVAKVEQRDEIGTLALAFNSMTAQLRSLIGSLETRVEARTAQLRAGADVARAVSSILDSDVLLQQTVNLIRERFGLYHCSIFLLDEQERFAVLRAGTGEAGRALRESGHKLEKGGQSMVGWVCANKQPRIALDVGKEAVRFANPLLPDTRSEATLPLQVGSRILGALNVQSSEPAAFDENDIVVLQGMADQIAVALENARLFTQTQTTLSENERLLSRVEKALQEATTLYEASQAISTAPDNSAVFQAVVDHVLKPDVDLCMLVLFEAHEIGLPQALEISNVWTRAGQPGTGVLAGARFEMARFPLREFLRADQSEVIRSQTQLPVNVAAQKLWESLCAQSLAFVPLNAGARWIGALCLGAASDAAFAPEALRPYQSAANQVAIAIENRRLYENAQTNLQEMSALYRTFSREAWEQVIRARPALSQYDYVRLESQDDTGSGLRVPLKLRDQEIGYLELEGSGRGWTEETRTLVEAVSAQVALTLESARLFDQTQRLAGRERLVNEIASRIRASATVPDILQTAARELAAALSVPHAVARIQIKDEGGTKNVA